MYKLKCVGMQRLCSVCQACNPQVFTYQFEHTMAHFDEGSFGSATAQRLDAYAPCSCEEIQKTRIFYAHRENIEESRLHTVNNGACPGRFGRFQFAALSFTSHY